MTNEQGGRLNKATTQRVLLMSGIGIVTFTALIILVVMVVSWLNTAPGRSESYKTVSGAAGLVATIDYQCKGACKQKYNFNVYIFRDTGQQVAVVRPDDKGTINAALPEGEYIMLITQRFGSGKTFPEEHLSLKNGKQLELKLHYGEVSL